jgi:hypothetical protein
LSAPVLPSRSPLLTSVYDRLDAVVSNHLSAAATADVPKLVTALSSVLSQHQLDEHGQCALCRPRAKFRGLRALFNRTPSTPCRAYLSTYLSLVLSDEPDTPAGPDAPAEITLHPDGVQLDYSMPRHVR